MKLVLDSNIIFSALISGFAISTKNWRKADELCRDVDEKDTPFVALSLEFEIPLCTNDKALCEGLKKKGFDNFVTLEDVLNG